MIDGTRPCLSHLWIQESQTLKVIQRLLIVIVIVLFLLRNLIV